MDAMTPDDLTAAIREAHVREANDPHRVAAESSRSARPAFVECACGRRFDATTWGRAIGSWRRHRTPAPSARFVARSAGRGTYRVVDTTTGVIHSAHIADKERARRQADRMNARIERTR